MDRATAIEILKKQLGNIVDFKPDGKIFSLNYKKDLSYNLQLVNGVYLRKKYCQTAIFISWEISTIAILNNIFGPTHPLVVKFKMLSYDNDFNPSFQPTELDYALEFLKGIELAEKILDDLIFELRTKSH